MWYISCNDFQNIQIISANLNVWLVKFKITNPRELIKLQSARTYQIIEKGNELNLER